MAVVNTVNRKSLIQWLHCSGYIVKTAKKPYKMGVHSCLRQENPSYLRQRKQSLNLTVEALFFRIMKMSGGTTDEAKGFSYIFNRAGTHSGRRCFD